MVGKTLKRRAYTTQKVINSRNSGAESSARPREKDGKKVTTGTVTHKFEFYSETLKKALGEHAEKHKTDVRRCSAGLQAIQQRANRLCASL